MSVITDLPVPHILRADAEFPVSGDAIARLRGHVAVRGLFGEPAPSVAERRWRRIADLFARAYGSAWEPVPFDADNPTRVEFRTAHRRGQSPRPDGPTLP